MPFIEINGAHLHFTDVGEGPEVVFFSHGFLWSGAMFDNQVARLRDRYRCITYDHRGQGQSAVCRSGYDIETLTKDAEDLITKLVGGPVHFVGLSMGGFVGIRLAVRRKDLIKSLILIETSADPEPATSRVKYMLLGGSVAGFPSD